MAGDLKYEIRTSGDGSNTIYLPELNETYHSTHGALNESQHVFINQGLDASSEVGRLSILEVGFGTGLNAFLTLKYSLEKGRDIYYESLEPFPVSPEIINQLNYKEIIGFEESRVLWDKMHQVRWDHEYQLADSFTLHKQQLKLQHLDKEDTFDVVYYDAFAPGKQKEMWECDVLSIVHAALKYNGFLVTYCSSGQFKRNLKEVGFRVEVLSGPPGKREMVRAVKG